MTSIRAAAPADAAPLAAIVNSLLTTTTIEWRHESYSAGAMSEWMAAHDCVLVAENEGEVVGLAAFGPFRDITKWPGYRFTVENTIHVRQDHWGRGVGAALMTSLINAARERGMHSIIAAVDGANDKSIQLHERLGFVEVARMAEVGAKFGVWLDLALLQLLLDDRISPGED
jgi:L-amino acid N-acyltransferase